MKYILLGSEFQGKLEANSTGGTVKGIKGSILHKLTIPVPDIDTQKRVVYMLENYDELYSSILKELPAEISARVSQYEYYRNKLLTFEELKE